MYNSDRGELELALFAHQSRMKSRAGSVLPIYLDIIEHPFAIPGGNICRCRLSSSKWLLEGFPQSSKDGYSR